jgi:ATP-dependent protease ClpP protease subunit
VARTNITAEEFEENKDREQYFLAAEAKNKGIIDKIVGLDVPLSYIL